MYKKGLYIALMIIGLVLSFNLLIVSYEVKHKVQKELRNQMYVLSSESSKIFSKNRDIVRDIANHLELSKPDDLAADFMSYVSPFIKNSSSIILITDRKDQVIGLSNPYYYRKKSTYDLSRRQYIKDARNEPNKVHIGNLIYSDISDLLIIPIAKAILDKNGKYLGAVAMGVPLTHFSESLFSAHIQPLDIEFHQNQEKSNAELYNDELISKSFILRAAFSKAFKTKVSMAHSGVSDLTITLSIDSSGIQEMFWLDYIERSLTCYGLIIIALFLIAVVLLKIITPMLRIQEKFFDAATKLYSLVPGYSPQRGLLEMDAMTNIENFANANDLVIEALIKQQEIIKSKQNQLAILQQNFSISIGALQESSVCLSENIDDIILDNKDATESKSSRLISALENIYRYSKNHEEHVKALRESLALVQEISAQKKCSVDIADMIQNQFGKLYRSLAINRSSVLNNREFYPGALENTLRQIFAAFPDGSDLILSLSEAPIGGPVTIEIFYKPVAMNLDSVKLQLALEQARLFALLDAGVIDLYKGENVIILTIVYAEILDLPATKDLLQ